MIHSLDKKELATLKKMYFIEMRILYDSKDKLVSEIMINKLI